MKKISTKINELEHVLSHNLKPSRYQHSIGVEKMAKKLAKAHKANVAKASFAGRYHDIAKCYTLEESNRLTREYGLSELYWNRPQLAHSKLAARMLKLDYGVTSRKVINAVANHTTGRPYMKKLEEIVYVADAIEENREYEGVEDLRMQALNDLDGACLFIMDYTIDRLKRLGMFIDDDTLQAREYIASKIKEKK